MSETTGQARVFVVDDDAAMRDSIACLLESENLSCKMFSDAGSFLAFCDRQQLGCILLDIRMPGISGMELLENLKANGIQLPVIVITGHGDVPLAVRALKLGAFDFLQKPFSAGELLERVHAALDLLLERRQKSRKQDSLRSHFDALTKREREIMELVVAGDQNKVIGMKLGISTKTVDNHRANIMRKLNIRNVAELVQSRLALDED